MSTTLYDLLNSAGEIRIEIGGKEKYRYLTEEEILYLLDTLEQVQNHPIPRSPEGWKKAA